MADKFQNKYRIPSARASWWNYGDDGNYFITINTYNKNHWFGEIVEGEMRLSEVGRIVEQCWNDIPKYFPYVLLDSFVVMPNHVHGILIIDKKNYCENEERFACRDAIPCVSNQTQSDHASSKDAIPCVSIDVEQTKKQENNIVIIKETQGIASLLDTDTANKFGPQSHNLASIIRGFKSGVTKNARKSTLLFAWQRSYYDHIIRSTDEYIRISHYICTNVACWEEDCFYQNGMRI